MGLKGFEPLQTDPKSGMLSITPQARHSKGDRRDSNPRHPEPQSGDLPADLRPPRSRSRTPKNKSAIPAAPVYSLPPSECKASANKQPFFKEAISFTGLQSDTKTNKNQPGEPSNDSNHAFKYHFSHLHRC